MRRITLKDLADRMEVSQATISRALRDDPKISALLRNRIKLLAQELGYRPNVIMSELAACRWQTAGITSGCVLAYIIQNPPGSKMGIPAQHLIAPARAQAALLGYHLQVFGRAEFASSDKLQRALVNRGITDLILGPSFDKSFAIDFDWDKFIAIQLIPGRFRSPLHSVQEDHFANFLLVWQKVMSRGYERIGVILLDHGLQLLDDLIRLGAVHACQTQLSSNVASIPPFCMKPQDNREKDFVRWAEKNQPDAIISFSGEHFHIFRRVFGYTIPYALLNKGSGMPEFSGISDPTESLNREGVNLLHFCRRTHQWGIPKQRIEHVIEPTWFEGETLPVKKAGQAAKSSGSGNATAPRPVSPAGP